MPTRVAVNPAEAAAKAVDALLTAIDGAPGPCAVAAYRAAIVRHGRDLVDTAGADALRAVLALVAASGGPHAAARRARLGEAWAALADPLL